MSSSVRKRATIAVLAAGALLAVFFAAPDGSREDESIRDVAEVRHSEVGDVPREPDRAGRTMIASYYGREFEGRPMASGEPFDADAYTAAHKRLPFGTKLGVAYGDEYVQVTVTDRGPYAAGHDLDLSLAAAREIGPIGPGEAPVRVTRP
ncbi:MAG TPA: septal ring lytic transglycosylase RlpA family protein [Rubrobacter sp.]|nr:septal ring lytic transglycosylase RlpA family protein [Rubrobacter sp.]